MCDKQQSQHDALTLMVDTADIYISTEPGLTYSSNKI